MKLILTLLAPLALFAQFRSNQIRIIPTTDGTAVGQIEFDTTRADGKTIVLKAPNTATAGYTLTLPGSAPANNGDCLVGSTAGVLSFATCPGAGGVWTESSGNVYRSSGNVGIGNTSPQGKLAIGDYTIVNALDGGAASSDVANNLRYDGSDWKYLNTGASGVLQLIGGELKYFTTPSGSSGATATLTQRLNVSSAGASVVGTLDVSGITTLSGDLRFGADNTHAIGQTGTRPSVIYSRIDNTGKLEIFDISGGSAFWDFFGSASFASNAILTQRDPAGSRWATVTRAASGVAQNRTNLFTDLIPSLRSTGSGDAVTDTTLPALGATGSRWSTAFINLLDVTESLSLVPSGTASLGASGDDWNRLWVGGVEATSFVRPQTDNGGTSGSSSRRWSATYTVNLEADGTVKLGTSSTVGYVWTATDTAGNGSWAPAGSSQWTTSGSDIYYSAGNVGINQSSPQGKLAIGAYTILDALDGGSASTDLANNLRFDGTNWKYLNTGAGELLQLIGGALKVFTTPSGTGGATATLTQRLNFSQAGNLCLGCTSDTHRLEVSGTLHATGATTLAGSLEVTGAVRLSNGSGNLRVLTSDASGNATWQDVGPCATCVVTGASNQSIGGTKTFTGILTGTAGGSITGGDTTIHGLRFAADATHTIGTTSVRPSNTFTRALTASGAVELGTASTFTIRNGATITIETGGPGVNKVLTSDAAGVATWADIGPCATCVTTAANNVSIAGTKTFTGVLTGTGGGSITGGNTTVEGIRFAADSTYTIGVTGTRPSNIFTRALTASGAIEFGSASTLTIRNGAVITIETGSPGAGKVLTSDASGNATWVTPTSSQWTTSGSNIHYSAGNVGINQSSPQGRLAIGNFTVFNALDGGSASTDIADNLRFDGTNWRYLNTGAAAVFQLTAGDLKLYTAPSGTSGGTATLTQRMNLSRAGNLCVGCTNDVNRLEVNGAALVTGAATLSSTLSVSGATTISNTLHVTGAVRLSNGSANLRVLTSDASGNATWQDTAPCATCVTTAANNVSIAGVKTFTGVLTGTAGASITGGTTTVEGIRFAAGTHTVGTAGARPSNIFTDSLQIYTSAELKVGGTFTFLGDVVANSLTITPSELGFLDGVTSNIQTQINGRESVLSFSSPLSRSGNTISCPTCYTTGGGTISGAVQVAGSLTPSVGSTHAFGSTFLRWTTLWAQTLNISSGTVAPDGNNGISATVTVRNAAGTGSCTLVFSGGLLTGGTC